MRNADWAWNFGAAPAFDASFARRFDWGGVELQLRLEEGRVAAATLILTRWTPSWVCAWRRCWRALALRPDDLAQAAEDVSRDVAAWLAQLKL